MIRDNNTTPIHSGVQGEGSAGDTARLKVHLNQVSTWKQRAVERMKEVFTKAAERARGDHEGDIRDLHAQIGALTVRSDFLAKGLKWCAGRGPGP